MVMKMLIGGQVPGSFTVQYEYQENRIHFLFTAKVLAKIPVVIKVTSIGKRGY